MDFSTDFRQNYFVFHFNGIKRCGNREELAPTAFASARGRLGRNPLFAGN